MRRPLRSGRWVAVFLVLGVGVGFRPGAGAAEEKAPAKPDAAKTDTVKLVPTLKRRTPTTGEELRKQLESVPEAGFDQKAAGELYTPIIKSLKADTPVKQLPADLGSQTLQENAARENRPEMMHLPWIVGADSELTKRDAGHLQTFSTKLRAALLKAGKSTERPDPEKLGLSLSSAEWTTPAAVPTITQVMQAESTAVRLFLVEMLAQITGKEASIALAKRAIFDLSPEVRARAVRALATRPPTEYTPVLYDGFRYPWPAAADHAAEAVAELKRAEMVPELVKLLKEPSPTLPVKAGEGYTVQEVVRINHLCNCMLCHAPSLEKGDSVRMSVPIPGERFAPYYDRPSDFSVRADLTYLRQDFSVVQPVAKPNKWPAEQRYDYMVRTRALSKTEQAEFEKLQKEDKVPKSYPQQAAVVFALQELTGRDHGTTYESWFEGLKKPNTSPRTRDTEKPDPQREKP
jgi:hypothetical protein